MESEQVLELIENAQASGKVRCGVNEVTKFLERGTAKLVVAATDVSPKELIMHLPLLAKEKGAAYAEVSSKEELGAASGIGRSTAAIAIIDGGNAKDLLKSVVAELTEPAKEEKKEEPKAEEKEEKVEEKKEEASEEPTEEVKEEVTEEKKEAKEE